MSRDRIIQVYRGTTAQNDAFTGAAGEITMDTTRKELRVHDGSTAGGNLVGLKPGFVCPFAGTTAPDGWLICDGSAVSRTTYADLFAVIGTTYGAGDGNSTFNLPNKSPTRQVIEFQAPTAQNNSTWYRLYDDGWVEQGGYKEPNTDVILPVAMSDSGYNMTFGSWYYSTSAGTPVIVFGDRTATQFYIQGRWNGGSQSGVKGYWHVAGMSARGATQQNIVCIKY